MTINIVRDDYQPRLLLGDRFPIGRDEVLGFYHTVMLMNLNPVLAEGYWDLEIECAATLITDNYVEFNLAVDRKQDMEWIKIPKCLGRVRGACGTGPVYIRGGMDRNTTVIVLVHELCHLLNNSLLLDYTIPVPGTEKEHGEIFEGIYRLACLTLELPEPVRGARMEYYRSCYPGGRNEYR